MADDVVQIYLGRQIDAELIAANLQGHGIPAVVRRSGAAAAYPGVVGALGETRVFVAAEHVDAAIALMEPDDDQPLAEKDLPAAPARRTILRWIIAVVLITLSVSAWLAGLLRTLIP